MFGKLESWKGWSFLGRNWKYLGIDGVDMHLSHAGHKKLKIKPTCQSDI
jgi:hypothetical protein